MSYDSVNTVLSAAVAASGTFTVGYPTGRDSGSYVGTFKHKIGALQSVYTAPADFTLTFGTSNITVNWGAGKTTLPAGTVLNLQLDKIGDDERRIRTDVAKTNGTVPMTPVLINLGAPDVADADGISASATVTAPANAVIGGALAAGGVATFDVPRNVVGAWTNTAVVTIVGTDEYGNAMQEVSASGTSHAGKKAFKTVTRVTPSATITGATFGTGDVIGLPVALAEKAFVVKELEDGAAATAGTLLGAVRTAASGTTGDVRGTYDPNSACDGAKAFQLLAYISDPTDKGVSQYAG